jgi:hypothetical protein
LFPEKLATRQNAALARLTRWYTTPELFKMATAANGELLALSGPRNPYPGKLGVVEEGALADLLLVDGNPIENIGLIEDPAKNCLVIMNEFEKNIIWRAADLLGVSSRQRVELRQRIAASMEALRPAIS